MNGYYLTLKASIRQLFQKKSVRDYASVTISQFAVKPIVFVRGIIVAKYLGPNDFGLLKGVGLISMLNKFGNLGFTQYAMREIGAIKNSGKQELETDIRNTAYSSELLLILILFLACVVAGIFANSMLVSIAIILSGISMMIDKVVNMLVNDTQINREFVKYSKIMFVITLTGALLTIVSVPFWGIYASLTVPIFVLLFKGRLFYKNSNIQYQFQIKKKLFKKQFLVGLQLTLGTLSYGSYRYAERLLIIRFLDLASLGFYGLADTILAYSSEMFLSAIRVRKMNLFEILGKKEFLKSYRMVVKETLILLVGSFIMIVFVWLFLDYFIQLILPQYENSILIIKIFILALPIKISTLYINGVLTSAQVNLQKYIPVFHISSTIFLVVASFTLSYFDLLTLTNFILCDLIGNLIFHISLIILFKIKFYDIYCRDAIYKLKSSQ